MNINCIKSRLHSFQTHSLQSRYSGLLRAKVEKAEGNKKLIDLTEMQTGSKLHSVCITTRLLYFNFFRIV